MAQGLEVLIEFFDGREPEKREYPMQYRTGEEQKACLQLLAAINSTGGLMDFTDNSVTLLPMTSIKSIRITAPLIIGGDLCDLRQLDATVNAAKVTL